MRTLLEALPGWLVVAVVAASVLLETGVLVGLVLPGTTAVLALGVLSGLDVLPLWAAVLVGVLAAVAGTQVAFLAGRRTNERHHDRLVARVGSDRWDRTVALVQRHGLAAVPVGQALVGARTLTPRVIAIGGVRWRRWAAVGVPSAAVWAAVFVVTGHLAGANADAVASLVTRAGWWSLAVVVVLTAAAWLFMVARRRGVTGAAGG